MLSYLVSLLAVCGLAQAQLDVLSTKGGVEGAFIIASKRVTSSILVVDKELTVEYNFMNIGDSDATNVEMVETGFPAKYFTHIQGHESIKFATLPKQSNVTHVLIYKPLDSIRFNMTSTNFTYHDGAKKTTGLSSYPVLEFIVYPYDDYYTYSSSHS
eukprot:Ihof_evm3s440 gene=Ihof_evmTU3s440